jgi:NTF2-related export protein 1/2
MAQATMPDGKSLPIIVFNGNSIPDAVAMQKMFEKQMPPAKYQVQCYDCQVINPNYVANNTQSGVSTSGKNMSILVSVSGYVKFGEPRGAKLNGFSETFVLIPNPAVVAGNKGKNRKGWLIQSQTFRLVV